jgi:CheY-like chemotaxis protein
MPANFIKESKWHDFSSHVYMKKLGPIIIVDDDPDDHHIAREVITELGLPNRICPFTSCQQALDYLIGHQDEQPFIIVSDINMQRMDGIEFKKAIDNHDILRKKRIPFIYYSTAASPGTVSKAFELQVQGFFTKKYSVEETKACFKLIFDYWSDSKHPEG